MPSASPDLPPIDESITFDQILAYLNQGGALDALRQRLAQASLLPPGTPGLSPLDFDGDGLQDLIVVLLPNPTSHMVIPPGSLYALRCSQARYELVFQLDSGESQSAPLIHAAEDLTGDGASDLLLGMQFCGAHTCFESLQVLVWNGQSLENRLQGSSEDLPTPEVQLRRDPLRIVVTAQGINSVGAGPFRPLERQWAWDPLQGAFVPGEDRLLESPYRIHKLHDADRALREGRYQEALQAYLQVRGDPQLKDWTDPAREKEVLAAFADYRRVLALLAAGQPDAARQVLQEMEQGVDASSPGAPYLALAERLWQAYEGAGQMAEACAQVRTFAEQQPETFLDPLYFGYANPQYQIEDLCPW